MKCACATPIVKRAIICKSLGVIFGLLCAYLASQGNPTIWDYKNPLFWSIVFNRFLLGIMILFAGYMTIHPMLKFKLAPWFRGTFIGTFVSLDIAIPIFMAPNMTTQEMSQIFWATIIAGALYGLVIDILATKFGGEGKVLLEVKN